jgi:hypothetical protein
MEEGWIYARVSTDDTAQDPENRRRQLREWWEHMGYPIEHAYVEHENGSIGLEYRKQLGAMFPAPHDASSTYCWPGHSIGSAAKAWRRRLGTCRD